MQHHHHAAASSSSFAFSVFACLFAVLLLYVAVGGDEQEAAPLWRLMGVVTRNLRGGV